MTEYWKNGKGNFAAYSIGEHLCQRTNPDRGEPCGEDNCNIVTTHDHQRTIRGDVPQHIAVVLAEYGFHRVEIDE